MVSASALLSEVVDALLPAGLDKVELLVKEGRTRRASLGPEGQLCSLHQERGWAVRASGDHASLFCSGAGDLDAANRIWPAPAGLPLKLPSPRPVSDWRAPADLESPLAVEHEALEILEACSRELARELPEAQLLQASLEDGRSTARILSTRGVEAELRQRTATLYLEAAAGGIGVSDLVGGRNARAFNPRALARRLTDRLSIRLEGTVGARNRGPFLLAPPVATRILASLLPLFMEAGAGRGLGVSPGERRIGSPCLTVIDDGRFPGGLFASPVDGEGMPTGRTVLLERGELRSPLGVSPQGGSGRSWGCTRRSSYRDIPRVGPSHLYIEPSRDCSAASLLTGMARGYYLLEPQDAGRFDLAGDRFELKVGGFAVRNGRRTATISGGRLSGRISRLLAGVQAVARDLTWTPIAGLLGSPSLLVDGLEINAA